MKKNILFIVVTLLFQCGVKGKPLWKSIDNSDIGKCLSIATIEDNENKYKAKIEIHGFYDDTLIYEGTTYHQLSFGEPGLLDLIGKPALPVISRLIAIPKGENFEAKILNEKWIDDIFVGEIVPRQKSVLETEKTPFFEKDEPLYSGLTFQPEIIRIGELQNWRGINNRALNICPFRYKPRDGKISVLKEFILEITFMGTENCNPKRLNDTHLFLNKIEISEKDCLDPLKAMSDFYDYLIITGDITGVLECQALEDFQKWKAYKGFKTKVVSTNTIGSSAAQIKQFITNEYPKGLKYVLFIGDSDKIPLYNYYSNSLYQYAKSDYWYGCISGNDDVQADVCIGRFSTNNLSELSNMVNKTILYEGKVRTYGKESLLVAHMENAPYKYQGCSETIRLNNYNETLTFTTAYGAPSSNGGDNATNAFVINKINEGKNIINYRGHGDFNQWWNWNAIAECFYDTQINELNNATNDVYFCVACQNGNIHNHTCFMETFMRSNHGAAGMIAATEDTYTTVNHTFNQCLFSKLLNENIFNIGDLNIAAHVSNIGTYTGGEYKKAVFNAFSYLCGCDPSLEIITDNTNTFDDYHLSLENGNLIIDSGHIYDYKISIVNADGTFSFAINSTYYLCSFPAPTENFYLVLNKHNYVPRIIYVNVTDSYIQNKIFDDACIDYYYIKESPISAGYDVTSSISNGIVKIENGGRLNISNRKDVLIKNGFECKIGGELLIK